jgi:hypothetical protein
MSPKSQAMTILVVLILAILAILAGAAYAVIHMRAISASVVDGPEALLESTFILLTAIVVALTLVFVGHLLSGHELSIDRKWGSLGNFSNGWSITPALGNSVGLIAALFALICLGYEISRRASDSNGSSLGSSPTATVFTGKPSPAANPGVRDAK